MDEQQRQNELTSILIGIQNSADTHDGDEVRSTDEPGPSRIQTRTVKVWNAKKTCGKVVVASTFEGLIQKAKTKFNIVDEPRLVLEDGCEIDDDEAFTGLFAGDEILNIFILKAGEELAPSTKDTPLPEDRLHSILNSLKRKRVGEMKKPEPITISFTYGWFNFNEKLKRYVNVRSLKGVVLVVQNL